MLKPGLLLACLFILLGIVCWGQQAAPDPPTDGERIAQLEQQVKDMQRAIMALGGNGAVEMAPAALETRLTRIEARLDRVEQQTLRSTGPIGTSSDRMMDGRLRSLENAVMRLQQQR